MRSDISTLGAGAIARLVQMATFAGDMNKLGAVGTLDVLSLNNPQVHAQLRDAGATKVLDGLSTMGSGLLREEAGVLGKRLGGRSSWQPPLAGLPPPPPPPPRPRKVRTAAPAIDIAWLIAAPCRSASRARGGQ